MTADGEQVVARSRPLEWDGRELLLGPPRAETVTRAVDGLGFVDDLRPGEWISMHWGWVCDRLTPEQLRNLQGYSGRILELTNRRLAHPGPALILG